MFHDTEKMQKSLKRNFEKRTREGSGDDISLSLIHIYGQTWLWTGSDCKGNDVSRAISGFRYQKNKTLRKHGTIHYKIPDAKSKKYMTCLLYTSMDCRGFKDAAQMNAYMIKQWNSRVRPKDEVVILGDFSVGKAKETNERCV